MEKKHNLKFAFSQISCEWWCMVYSGGGGGRTHGRVTNFVEKKRLIGFVYGYIWELWLGGFKNFDEMV